MPDPYATVKTQLSERFKDFAAKVKATTDEHNQDLDDLLAMITAQDTTIANLDTRVTNLETRVTALEQA